MLRNPESISDDAITVFTDGSARRGAGGSSAGARTEVLSAVWHDGQKLEAADRMTSISKGGRDLWGEFKSRFGIGLRGGEAPPMDTWGGRSEAGGTSVSTRTRIGRHVPGRLPGVCEVHHIGLDDYERAAKKSEAMYKSKLRQRERERRERLMASQQGIPLQPTTTRPPQKKKKPVRRDWDNRSLETTTTLAAPALTATPVSGRRKDPEYERYAQEPAARPRGWQAGDSELPEVSYGYNPQAYVKPKHLAHHMSTRTNRSYLPGDDPGDVPPPIRMKPKRQSMPPPLPSMAAEPVSLRKESTRKDKHRGGQDSSGAVKRERSHRQHSRAKEVGGGGKGPGGGYTSTRTSTKAVGGGGKGYVAASTKEVGGGGGGSGGASAPSRHRSQHKRQVTESTAYTSSSSEEEYTSSEEEESSSDEYTTDSDSDGDGDGGNGDKRKPDLGTKVYHHPLAKRDVWSEVITAGGSGSASAPPPPTTMTTTRSNPPAAAPPPSIPPPPPGHRSAHTRTGSVVMERVQQFQSRASLPPPAPAPRASLPPPAPAPRALPGPGMGMGYTSGSAGQGQGQGQRGSGNGRDGRAPAPAPGGAGGGYRRNR